MTALLAVDPGTTQSGWVVLAGRTVTGSGVADNHDVLAQITQWEGDLAIEMFSAQGMPVGRETFETVRWIGRFQQAFAYPEAVIFVYRRDVQLHLCGTTRAKDPNVRQALIDLIGPPGRKSEPGPTLGVTSHSWAALGVAVTARRLGPAASWTGESAAQTPAG